METGNLASASANDTHGAAGLNKTDCFKYY